MEAGCSYAPRIGVVQAFDGARLGNVQGGFIWN